MIIHNELKKDTSSQQVATPNTEQQNSFETIIPSIQKLIIWLIYITGFGLFIFPFFAFTLDPKFAIHFWVMTALDFGLLVALLNFKRFIVSGNTLSQDDETTDVKKQDTQSTTSNNNNSSKKQQNLQKKNKKNE